MLITAWVHGKPLTELPQDLFIHPDYLNILLESFTGPLDLLLYLIRRQDFDIMDIPIVLITEQYLQYIEMMEKNRLELAPDYLVMAATLAEIKSKLLLPKPPITEEQVEEDPRKTLAERLQIYAQFKEVSEKIDKLPRVDRDIFPINLTLDELITEVNPPHITLSQLVRAWEALQTKSKLNLQHTVLPEIFSTKARVTLILAQLKLTHSLEFVNLYKKEEGRLGVVVSFLAILELCKQVLIEMKQDILFGPIVISKRVEPTNIGLVLVQQEMCHD